MKKIKKIIPNILTTLRLGMVGIFVYAFLSGNPIASLVMFSTASITDFLDGYLARKWDATSNYGKTLDPIADKLLMGSALLLYGSKYNSLMFVPLIMEGLISAVNTYFVATDNKVSVNKSGKVKTAALMSTISIALLKSLNIESLNFITNNVINSLIFGTTVLQASTVKHYINDNISINNNRINEENSLKDRNEKIEYLKKEKESLINKEIKIKELKKRKDK